MASVEDFRAFVATMALVEKTEPLYKPGEPIPEWSENAERTSRTYRLDGWWYAPDPGFDDFNKEIVPPGVLDALPEGGVGIRTDDDFWTEAVFPHEFRDISIQDMVAILWPEIQDPVFHEDVIAEKRKPYESFEA